MGIDPINKLAFAIGALSFIFLLLTRIFTKRGKPEVQVIWAVLGGLCGGAIIKSSYPFYRVFRYSSLNGIEDLWLYVLVGAAATAALSFIGIYNAWKTA